jgi:hypothetical protein
VGPFAKDREAAGSSEAINGNSRVGDRQNWKDGLAVPVEIVPPRTVAVLDQAIRKLDARP